MGGHDSQEPREPSQAAPQAEDDKPPDPVGIAASKLAEAKPEKFIREFVAMGMDSNVNPLHRVMTPEHISKILAIEDKSGTQQHDLLKRGQWLVFVAFAALLLFILVFAWLFRDQPAVLVPALTGLGGFLAGGLGGYGMGSRRP